MSVPQLAGTPVVILKEGSSRSRGRDALHANIMSATEAATMILRIDDVIASSNNSLNTPTSTSTGIPGPSPYMR